ncbi:hypothetical protein JCM11251_003170 [Rhodosporidiobolus azoricus]
MEFSAPPTLVFPSALDSFQQDRAAIRGQLRDTYNRLHSIADDANFVHEQVAPAYPDFPVVANQRAGAWYVKPSDEKAHAYFKSTDGHANEHNFNLRRANLALLPLIRERQGIIFVDSTRRGKRFPDALSKTIPLWCAVLNRARVLLSPPFKGENADVTPEEWDEMGGLYTSPQAVGRSEHSQIEVKIEGWAKDLVNSAYDLTSLLSFRRPLRPFFISPSSTLPSSPLRRNDPTFSSCYPIICCSASKLVGSSTDDTEVADWVERERGFTYVQGSGDDHEAWSRGLTPGVFWRNSEEILSASRDEIEEVVARVVMEGLKVSDGNEKEEDEEGKGRTPFTPIRSTGLSLSFAVDPASLPTSSPESPFLITVSTSRSAPANPSSSFPPARSPTEEPPMRFDLLTRPGKAGYSSFFTSTPTSPLTTALDAASAALKDGKEVRTASLTNEEGSQSETNDLGVAIGLILLVRLFDSSAALLPAGAPTPPITKDLIRSRLQWILEACPTINPSRASLNQVNTLLMSRR